MEPMVVGARHASRHGTGLRCRATKASPNARWHTRAVWRHGLRVSCLTGLAAVLVGWSSGGEVVLGSKTFAPFGTGWGTAKPRLIHNGGVPSGSAWKIRWR